MKHFFFLGKIDFAYAVWLILPRVKFLVPLAGGCHKQNFIQKKEKGMKKLIFATLMFAVAVVSGGAAPTVNAINEFEGTWDAAGGGSLMRFVIPPRGFEGVIGEWAAIDPADGAADLYEVREVTGGNGVAMWQFGPLEYLVRREPGAPELTARLLVDRAPVGEPVLYQKR